ncbi:MAG: hypothetical protein RR202_05655 [Bacteroidales bacterium]
MDIEQIMTGGVIFKKAKESNENDEKRVKTKAKKTTYVKGTHGSGAAKMKAAYKKRTQQRNKK